MHTRTFAGFLLVFLCLPSIAVSAEKGSAAPVVVSAGKEGRGYWGVASRLQAVGVERKLAVEILESVGSLQNLQRLADPENPVALALTQSDALNHYLTTNPAMAPRIEILEYIGQECVFVIADNDSAIHSDQDLQQTGGQRIAIRSPESGTAVTFSYMTLLEPALKNTSIVYQDPLQAMQNFDQNADQKIDAVMFVQRPKVHTPEIRLAIEQPENYRFVEVNSRKFSGKLPNGEQVYTFLDVPLLRSNGQVTMSVNSICTKGLLVTAAGKLSAEQRTALGQIIDYDWIRVYATER